MDRFGSLRLATQEGSGASVAPDEIAAGKLYTWRALTSDPFTTLVQITTDAQFDQDLGDPIDPDSTDSVSSRGALAEIDGRLVFLAFHARNIYITTLDATPVTDPWIITPSTDPPPAQLSVDGLGRLYVFCPQRRDELVVLRYLADGTFDRRFSLRPDPARGVDPATHDEAVTTSNTSGPGSGANGPGGMDVDSTGQYAYVTMPRIRGAGDTSLIDQAIYKYDLDAADPITDIAPSTVFSTIQWWQVSNPPNQMVGGDPSFLGSYAGLVVNPVDGRVAVQVTTHSTRSVTIQDVATPTATVDDFFYHLYLYDPDGNLLDDKLIAKSVSPHPGAAATAGISSAPIKYSFNPYGNAFRNMTWAGDGEEVYFWIRFDNGSALQFVSFNPGPPYEPTWLCNGTVGKIGSPMSENPTPNKFGYALLSNVAGTGCTDGAGKGDIYAYLGDDALDPNGDKVYRYAQTADIDNAAELKEVIPLIYTHDAAHTDKKAKVDVVRLVGGNLFLLASETPVDGYTGSAPSLHPTIVKVSGTSPHATTILYEVEGESLGDGRISGLTFDSTGNLYLTVRGAAGSDSTTASGRGMFLYKLNSSGIRQWRRKLDSGYDIDLATQPWLADDDATLLYMSYRGTLANHWETVRRYDIVTDKRLADWFKLKDADGSPPDFSQEDQGAVVLMPLTTTSSTGTKKTKSKMVVGIWRASSGILDHADVGYLGPDRLFYNSGRQVGGSYLDDSMALDLDPDRVSLWSHSGYAARLYRFDRTTRKLTKTLVLTDEGGDPQSSVPFAICGGQGGHGTAPPTVSIASYARGYYLE